MSEANNTRLTLEQRLELAAKSQAVSDEAASALVQRLSQIHPAYFLAKKDDLDLLYELTPESWETVPEVKDYRELCGILQDAFLRDNGRFPVPELKASLLEQAPCRPIWGARLNNTIVLLGLMIQDHAKGRLLSRCREIYACTRMSLKQYLNALAGPVFQRSESETEWFLMWQSTLLQEMDGALPLADALTRILERYRDGWMEFDRLKHILRCMGGLAQHLGRTVIKNNRQGLPESILQKTTLNLPVGASVDQLMEGLWNLQRTLSRYGIGGPWHDPLPEAPRDCPNPQEFFLEMAQDYSLDLPDLGGDIPPRAIRSQIYLPWEYIAPKRYLSPEVLRSFTEIAPFSAFNSLLEEYISGDRLISAMREINVAVTDLYMLWIEPYLHMVPQPQST